MIQVIPQTEARKYVLERCPVLPAVSLPLADAISSVLVSPVVAGEDVPPFANSAVDGYAVRAADLAGAGRSTPVELEVVAEVAAGASTDVAVGPGQAIRIMTGAPMPTGADSSVMVEDTERLGDGGRVRVTASVEPRGQAVRGVGEDVRVGATLFPAGTVVTPTVAGVLASINARTVGVVRAATVAVLSTGDELIDNGSALAPGRIPREQQDNAPRHGASEAGAEPIDLGVVRDDEAALEAVLRDAAERYDAIVTSGGVSAWATTTW